VREINNEVMDLITKYPELAKFFESQDGVLRVKEGMEDELENELHKKEMEMIMAQSGKIAADAGVVEAKRDVEYSNLTTTKNKQTAKTIDGALAGALAIGGAGAAIGSIFGPLGTAIGGIAGGLIGGIVGGVVA
jgi:phage tail tape-measure protein